MPRPFQPSPSETILLTPWRDPLATAVPTSSLGWEPSSGGGELQARVTACYAQLRALPRRLRRALQRQLVLPLAGVALLLALGQGSSQAAMTWTVCANGCNYTSIKAAIAAPATINGDTLAIAAGTYTQAGIAVNKSLTLQGQGAATTIVQAAATPGTASTRVFNVAPSVTVTIQALTIRHGVVRGTHGGGGLLNQGTLTLIDSTVSGNSADVGGGGLANKGTLTLTNSTISGNSGTHSSGGGLINYGTLTLTNSTVSGNSAGNGGGLDNLGTLTLTNSTVSGNSVTNDGGGGLNSRYGTLILTNSTVSGNSAGYFGGGFHNDGTLTLTNSTISGNSAALGGGGLYNGLVRHPSYRGEIRLTNSIVANNPVGGDCENVNGAVLISDGSNLDSDGSCLLTSPTDLPSKDPLLGPLQNNGGPTLTHALLPGSPAIDAIPWGAHGCGTTIISDQRWQARPQAAGGRCDIGAYEVEVPGQPLGAWVTGFTPHTVVCQNVTTGRSVTLSDPASAWNCETEGLSVTAGDRVSILARGPVDKGATDVGGAVVGMTPSSAGCTNLTTGQQVTFDHMVGATAGSCVAAGLGVHPGDQMQMSVAGSAE
jgi:hypothetical protein